MVAHAFDPSAREGEASRSLCVCVHPGLQLEFHDSQDFTEKNTETRNNGGSGI